MCRTREENAMDMMQESMDDMRERAEFHQKIAKCGQPERDAELLRKCAEKFAVSILTNLPNDYASRKRIITNGILAALKSTEFPL